MQKFWWALTTTVVLLGVASVSAGALVSQSPSGTRLLVDRVDATGDEVVVDGTLTGGDPAEIELTVAGKKTAATRAGGLAQLGGRNDVVVVLDNAEGLGNATVQLAKDGVSALMPSTGATSTLGVVSTGGAARVEAGATDNEQRIDSGIASIAPLGDSLTWDGLARAATLLENRPEGSVGTVVLFAASRSAASGASSSAAQAALRRAGVRLDVIAMQRGADLTALDHMVGTLGGSLRVVDNDEALAGAFDEVAADLSGRFRLTFPGGQETGSVVPLTLTSGTTNAQVGFVPGSVRTGPVALAPVVSAGGAGGFATSPMVKWLAVILLVGAAAVVFWTVLHMVLPAENKLESHLEAYDESFGVEKFPEYDPDEGAQATLPIIQRAVELTGTMAQRQGLLEKIETKLERANLPLRAAEAMFFTVAGAFVLLVITVVLTGSMVLALLVGALAVAVPLVVLEFKMRRRQKAFVRQLPDMLALLAGTLKAGYSVSQGFESVSNEIDDPMGRELRRVVTETRLGRSLEESLESVAERMDSDDFAWAVMAIRIQREVGGNLAELLMTVAETMTQRERLRREVSTLTAEGRMSAVIIGMLPPSLAGVLFIMNREYISALFQPGIGYILLGLSVFMMGVGFAWMKKCITIEV